MKARQRPAEPAKISTQNKSGTERSAIRRLTRQRPKVQEAAVSAWCWRRGSAPQKESLCFGQSGQVQGRYVGKCAKGSLAFVRRPAFSGLERLRFFMHVLDGVTDNPDSNAEVQILGEFSYVTIRGLPLTGWDRSSCLQLLQIQAWSF